MEQISAFDMFKIGIGPSSSHTLGPWKAARSFVSKLGSGNHLPNVSGIQVELYGSLALTGEGHGTSRAIVLGLSGADPGHIERAEMENLLHENLSTHQILLGQKKQIEFDVRRSVVFNTGEVLEFHSNGIKFLAFNASNEVLRESTYFSIGGGFVVSSTDPESLINELAVERFPYPVNTAKELIAFCDQMGTSIAEVVMANERSLRPEEKIRSGLLEIWQVMLESAFQGCHTPGILPGGLGLKRRAPGMHQKLYSGPDVHLASEWLDHIGRGKYEFPEVLDWISCFAIAVNEENANYGRIVTAPTNGSAGVIPAVLLYAILFDKRAVTPDHIVQFLLVASEVGSIFKKGATISAAAGGCQAEIGVSSAMAAAGLTYLRGGSPRHCLIAAEIAMEHHLGLTCDPIKGLVQIPCIERNSLGAIKAIAAAGLAHKTDEDSPKISLDDVVRTMWLTAQDMHQNYKETSLGGLAKTVLLPEC